LTRHRIQEAMFIARENIRLVNPFELAVAVSFLFIGLAILFIPPLAYPTSITALFSAHILRVLWGVCVTLSGFLKTAGLLTGNRNWRRAGLILISGVSWVFVMAIIAAGNVAFIFTGGIFVAISLASIAMYRRLR
jgi:hypothetical protein